MSDLQDVCRAVEAVCTDLRQQASNAARQAGRLRMGAAKAAALGAASRQPGGQAAAQSMHHAAKLLEEAALLLGNAEKEGRAFVSRNTKAGSGAAARVWADRIVDATTAAGIVALVVGSGAAVPIRDAGYHQGLSDVEESAIEFLANVHDAADNWATDRTRRSKTSDDMDVPRPTQQSSSY